MNRSVLIIGGRGPQYTARGRAVLEDETYLVATATSDENALAIATALNLQRQQLERADQRLMSLFAGRRYRA